jgi:hypothetical protein
VAQRHPEFSNGIGPIYLTVGLGLLIPDLLLRLLPILTCGIAIVTSLLVEFIGSLGYFQFQIGRGLAVGFRLRLRFGFWSRARLWF